MYIYVCTLPVICQVILAHHYDYSSCCREEDSLISTFIIEMLCVMLHSLKLAHKDDAALGMSL